MVPGQPFVPCEEAKGHSIDHQDVVQDKLRIWFQHKVTSNFSIYIKFSESVCENLQPEVWQREIMQLIPVAYAREMVSTLMKNIPGQEPNEDHSEPAPQKDDFITDELSMSWEETESQIDWGPEPVDFTVPPSPTTNPSAATTDNRSGIKKGQVAVRPVQFAGLDEPATQKEVRNIDIILDVPLDVAVELGKTKKSIKEILELGPGSIIQLDRLAGEPVDLLVNGKLIAKGEVVVIDENYGIRISAIVSPMDRMTKLQ